MKLSVTPFLAALAPFFIGSVVVDATSMGAGGCVGGEAAPTGHGVGSSGSLEDGRFLMIAELTGEVPGEFEVTLTGPEFKGFLFRTELGTEIVDMGIHGQEAAACEGFATGVTHMNPDPKSVVSAVFQAPEGATEATMVSFSIIYIYIYIYIA